MKPTQWATPDLQTLVDLFYTQTTDLGVFSEVTTDQVPEPYRELLAHTAHMTVTVERFHQSLVDVQVLQTHATSTHYARKILLSRQSDGKVVQFGIVRLNVQFMGEDVRREIESQSAPLGRILIQHDVMRTVKLLSLWKVVPGYQLKECFDAEDMSQCYGRTALIYCNNVPAVELLEIVYVA